MATGLDRIIEQILADAEAKAAEQVAAAEEEAKKTLADAAVEAEQKANVLLADSEKVGADIKARAASTAEFTRRRTVLAAKQNALPYLAARTEYFAALMELKPTGIKITSAQKRFGSCSGKNSICYSWRLMLYPPEAIDYVVVHELAHIVYKNHSAKFYALVVKYLPDYKEREKLLR